jgi:hypothetical protein
LVDVGVGDRVKGGLVLFFDVAVWWVHPPEQGGIRDGIVVRPSHGCQLWRNARNPYKGFVSFSCVP